MLLKPNTAVGTCY